MEYLSHGLQWSRPLNDERTSEEERKKERGVRNREREKEESLSGGDKTLPTTVYSASFLHPYTRKILLVP